MRIIYLLPTHNNKRGGIKVIYQHAEILNSMGIEALFYIFMSSFFCTWFKNNAIKKQQFLIFPMIF